jgi:hypothetical protein
MRWPLIFWAHDDLNADQATYFDTAWPWFESGLSLAGKGATQWPIEVFNF